ncbi:molybdopterin-dependent oxidoreductase [Chloroflexota bacterium]
MSEKAQADNGVKILKTACHLCHGGCILLAHVKDGKLVKLEGDPDGPHNRGTICQTGLAAIQYIYSPYRLKYPMKRVGERGEGKWQRISWDEALDTVAEKLQYYKDTYGPWSIAYTWGTGRVTRDIPFIGIFSGALGTPNGIGIGHLCLSKTRKPAMNMTFGQLHGPGAQAINRDFERSACIIAWGETLIEGRCDYMGTGGKRLSDALKRGAKLIVIDPVYTRAAQKAHIWLQIRPGTDLAIALTWMNIIINENLYDREFVEKWTNAPFLWRSDTRKLLRPSDVIAGGSAKHFMVWDTASQAPQVWNTDTVSHDLPGVKPALEGTYEVTMADGKSIECKTVWQLIKDNVREWTPEKAAEITWVPAKKIRDSALMYAKTCPACIEWGVALSQCTRSTATNQAVLQLESITGNIDTRGGNPFWQVPEFRNAGNAAKEFNQRLTPEQEAHRITGGFPFSANPELTNRPSAYQPDVWRAMLTEDPYPIKALFGIDSNPLCGHENPDKYILDAIKKVDFIVWCDMLMTPSNEYADIILPVTTPIERNWVDDSNEAGVFAGRAVVEPYYESKSDFDIYRELCVRWGREDIWPWKTEEEWCDWQLEKMGITFKELTKTCIYPAPEVWQKYEKGILREDGKPGFATVSGKCEIYASILEDFNVEPLPVFGMPVQSYETTPELAKEYPLVLITGSRELDYPFFHSQYREVPWLRESQPFPIILINPSTATKLGIKNGNWAWVETQKGRSRFKSDVTERISPKVVSVTHSWWYPELAGPDHGCFESSCNILVDPALGTDPATGTTELRGLLCKVYKADGPPPGVADKEQEGT